MSDQPIARASPDASAAAAARTDRDRLSQILRELKLLVNDAQAIAAIPDTIATAYTRTLTEEEKSGGIAYDVMVDEAVIGACVDITFVTAETHRSASNPAPSPDAVNAGHARTFLLRKICTLATASSTDRGLLIWLVSREPSESDIRAVNIRLKSRPVIVAASEPAWLKHVELPQCEKVTITTLPASMEEHLREAQELANAHGSAILERCGTAADSALPASAISADIAQRLSSRKRFLQTRLNAATLEAEIAESSRNDPSARNGMDTFRSAIDSKADEVMTGAQSVVAEWFGARGKLNQLVLTHIQNLGDDDFDTEVAYSKLVRRLSPRIGSELKIKLQQNAKDLFKAATKASRDATEILQQDCFARCRTLGVDEINYHGVPIDEDRGWAALKSQIEVPVDIKFEMHKRGILKRLSEGKQIMSTTMMTLGIVGMVVGFQWRQNTMILYALPVIFIAGVIYSFYSWKQEDRETLSKELDRVRETISRELSRGLSESERVIVEYIRRSITDSAKHLFSHIDQTMKVAATKQSASDIDRRNRLRDQIRRLETDIRAIDQVVAKAKMIRF